MLSWHMSSIAWKLKARTNHFLLGRLEKIWPSRGINRISVLGTNQEQPQGRNDNLETTSKRTSTPPLFPPLYSQEGFTNANFVIPPPPYLILTLGLLTSASRLPMFPVDYSCLSITDPWPWPPAKPPTELQWSHDLIVLDCLLRVFEAWVLRVNSSVEICTSWFVT
jgi:hypothetical protein